jgi:RelB antitoxin
LAALTVSDAFRLMMVRIAKDKALPFAPLVPNEETIAAMKAARRGQLECGRLDTRTASSAVSVGWVEQRETHHGLQVAVAMGFAALNPSYGPAPRTAAIAPLDVIDHHLLEIGARSRAAWGRRLLASMNASELH